MDGKKIIARNWTSVAQVLGVALFFAFLYATLALTSNQKNPLPQQFAQAANESKGLEKAIGNCTSLFSTDATENYAYYLNISAYGKNEESTYERIFGGSAEGGAIKMITKMMNKNGNITLIEYLDETSLKCKKVEVVLESPKAKPMQQAVSCASAPVAPFSFICSEEFKNEGSEQVETFAGNFTGEIWKNEKANATVWRAEGVPVPIKMDINASVQWSLARYT